jgi:hypothetical protein
MPERTEITAAVVPEDALPENNATAGIMIPPEMTVVASEFMNDARCLMITISRAVTSIFFPSQWLAGRGADSS